MLKKVLSDATKTGYNVSTMQVTRKPWYYIHNIWHNNDATKLDMSWTSIKG